MNATEFKRLKDLEEENRRLQAMYAELPLDLKLAKEIIEKSFEALPKATASGRGVPATTSRHQQGVPGIELEQVGLLLASG